jgi:hypothetical protein
MKGNSETGSPFFIADNTADLMQVTQAAPPSRASYRVGEWLQRFIAKCTGVDAPQTQGIGDTAGRAAV